MISGVLLTTRFHHELSFLDLVATFPKIMMHPHHPDPALNWYHYSAHCLNLALIFYDWFSCLLFVVSWRCNLLSQLYSVFLSTFSLSIIQDRPKDHFLLLIALILQNLGFSFILAKEAVVGFCICCQFSVETILCIFTNYNYLQSESLSSTNILHKELFMMHKMQFALVERKCLYYHVQRFKRGQRSVL